MTDSSRTSSGSLQGAEAELQRLRAATELATFGVWDWDLQTDELEWSDSLLELVGLSREEFRPDVSSFFERVHPDDVASVQAALTAHFEDNEPYDVVMRVLHECGDYVRKHIRGQALRDADGTPIRMVGIIRDLEDAEMRRQLDATERRLRDIAETVPGVMFQYELHPDGSDRMAYVSPGSVGIWGVEPALVEADPSHAWARIDPEYLEGMQATVARSAETLERWSYTYRITTPSGVSKYVQGEGQPRRREDGAIVWNSLVMDVTQIIEAEQELQKSRDLLLRAQKMEAMGQLTGGMAHDFNNLLTVILSSLERLQQGGFLSEAAREQAISDALGATRRGADLTRSLLSFARQAPLEPELLDLSDVADGMAGLLRRVLPANIELEIVPSRVPASVRLDRPSLESALLNLILNARDAMPDGGSIRVELRTEQDVSPRGLASGAFACLSVRDTGCGIPEEEQSRVLEPFFTTKGTQGSGMGLAMIDGFVTQSGGALEIESTPGRGTCVSLWFPLHDAGPAPARPRSRAPESAAAERLHVLLVEDQKPVRDALMALLIAAGHTVTAANDGWSALTLLEAREAEFDLVLTDMEMPGPVQGTDVAAHAGSRLPVILCSGNPPAEQLDGVSAHLTKPITLDELKLQVSSAMRKFSEGD